MKFKYRQNLFIKLLNEVLNIKDTLNDFKDKYHYLQIDISQIE